VLFGLLLALVVPALALAHPLGNFTINHYAGIRVEPDRVILDVVIDQAEIPTFQEKLRIDTDGDGTISDAEAETERVAACPVLATSLALTIGGAAAPLLPVEAGLEFPPGAAGLQTMRLVCTYTAALPSPLAGHTTIGFRDDSHRERIGWREITVQGSGTTVSAPGLVGVSVSERLRRYPQELIAQPLHQVSASLDVSAGGASLPPFSAPDATLLPGAAPLYATDSTPSPTAGPAGASGSPPVAVTSANGGAASVPGGVGGDISGLLQTKDLTPFVLLGSILAAMALGAGHAVTPGHGKTLMGAYLVGTRGTPIHAVALGLSVTVSHTLGIVALAAIVIAFRGVLPPETFNRLAPIASGLLVLTIGGWLLLGQIRVRRAAAAMARAHPPTDQHDHGAEPHTHAAGDPHDHPHEPDDTAEPGTSADGLHSHGGVRHSHLPVAAGTLTWRNLFVLGLAGGIIPSTNALIILLATIATGRAVYGMVLVIAFGLGMAVVLGGVGLGLVLARDRLDRLPSRSSLGRVAAYAPLLAGVVVFALGIYLTTQAVGGAPTL
jgi:ABC-type nickel/cobalt efflux system permease component RcnA